jgi:hypothetical protein
VRALKVVLRRLRIGAHDPRTPAQKEAVATGLLLHLPIQIPEGVVCSRACGACTALKVMDDVELGTERLGAAWAKMIARSVPVLAMPFQRMLVQEGLAAFPAFVAALANLRELLLERLR